MFTERRSTPDRRGVDVGPAIDCAERRRLVDRRSLQAHVHVEEYETSHEEHFPGIKVTTHMKRLM